MANNPKPTIRDLYPHLSEPELANAEANLERYVALVLRIFERVESEMDVHRAEPLTPDMGTLGCTPPSSQSSV